MDGWSFINKTNESKTYLTYKECMEQLSFPKTTYQGDGPDCINNTTQMYYSVSESINMNCIFVCLRLPHIFIYKNNTRM